MLLRVTGEWPNEPPTADAGPDRLLKLPTNSIVLSGAGRDTDGTITSYQWTQYGGQKTTIGSANTPTATLSGLKPGQYYFRLTVKDNKGATDYDNMLVTVLEN
jgi:hypothetical protein